MILPKSKPYRNKKYRHWVANNNCQACGSTGFSVPHHVPVKGMGGMGTKIGDDYCIALCHFCHMYFHERGPKEWEKKHKPQIEMLKDIREKYAKRS